MNPDQRLDAILARLGDMETGNAQHHARVEGEMARIGDRIDTLSERVKIQNGRVTASEQRLLELETKARIEQSHEVERDDKRDFVKEKSAALVTGSFLVVMGAVLGYFL